MADQPTGTLTLLFTDIEGSTRLLQELGRADYSTLLGRHHRLMRAAIEGAQGRVIKTEGDAFFAVFSRASDAVTAAAEMQRTLAAQTWPQASAVRVRMGIHSGDVSLVEGEYVGLDIHRAARIAAAAHGGQILVSDATRVLVGETMPESVSLRDIGRHRLKDLEEVEHLYQVVAPDLETDFPPLRSLSARLSVLPAEMTPFIGRERPLEDASKLLDRSRLLTLTGPGGTGKTRLALALARNAGEQFDDGVAFVELATIRDPELVAATVRHALGIREEPGRPALETLIASLRDRHLLLVLDNFEQVLPAAAVVSELLTRTERLTIVVTSRSTLHISGEQEFGVPSLELPTVEEAADLERLSRSEAVRLFVQRARTALPDFTVTAENAAAIADICRRLDGLPLAIELAASRIKLLPPAALLSRLERQLDLVASTAADRTDRQRTLRGAIDWSYDLLDEAARALFRRVSVFVGGFGMEAAEQLVPSVGSIRLDILDGLGALVDQSLIRQADAGGEPRFSMLETIHAYGREKLGEAVEAEAVERAHARLYLRLAIDLAPGFTRGGEGLDRIELEHDNVRAALRWTIEHGDIEDALAAAGALWRFWQFRGHLREGRRVVEDLLARPAASTESSSHLAALIGFAGLVYWQNDYERSESVYRDALALAQTLGDVSAEADILYSLSYLRAIPKDYDNAESLLRQAIARYGAIGDRLGVAKSQAALGNLESLRGRYREALTLVEQARSVMRELGETFLYLNSVVAHVSALLWLGELQRAREQLSEFLVVQRERGDMSAVGMALYLTASLAALEGRYEMAAQLLGAREGLHERLGGQAPPTLIDAPDPRPEVETNLDPTARLTAAAAGRRLDDADAIRLGVEATGQGPRPR